MQTVDIRDLTYDERGFDDAFYKGRLFTGLAVDVDGDGVVRGKEWYLDGWRHGPSRAWRQDGSIESEEYFRHGALHGPFREWDEGGRLILEEIWEYRLMICRRRWASDGVLIEDSDFLCESERRLAWIENWERNGHKGIVEVEEGRFVERPWPYAHLASPLRRVE